MATFELFMPALSSTMTEGKIVEWLKQPGDRVERGEPVLVVESDKADMDVESFEAGFLGAVLLPAGGTAPVGETIGLVVQTQAEVFELQAKGPTSAPPPTYGPPVTPAPIATPAPVAVLSTLGPVSSNRVVASPRARKLAQQLGVKLEGLMGSGPHGRLVAADVEKAAGKSPAQAAIPVEDVPLIVPISSNRVVASKAPLTSSWDVGRGYRAWVSSQAEANNAAIRSVLQDFLAGTDISLSLITDIATNRELRRFAGSKTNALSRNTCELIIDDLKKTYNDQQLHQARKFLEGFAGFVQGELTITKIKPQTSRELGPKNNQNQTQSRITSARSLYVEGALISIRALGRIETYIYYVVFIGIIDVLSAWHSAIKPTDFEWSLWSIGTCLWIFYAASLAITFHYLSGAGKSLSMFRPGEFGIKSWRAFNASFISGLYIFGGLLLAIIPGLLLSFRYILVCQVAVLENCGVEASLKRSRAMSPYVGGSIIKATFLSSLTYLFVIIVLSAMFNDAVTKTFSYNLMTTVIGSIWGIWLSGIVYCGYRKAAAAIRSVKAESGEPLILES